MEKKKDALVVVGLDFGTTYSGYAYSTRSDYKKRHDSIFINTKWSCEDGGFASEKTPTAILFDDDGKFNSFGYEAEGNYAELLSDGEADGYTYFTRFKMKLFQNEVNSSDSLMHPIEKRKRLISRDLLIEDFSGKTMKALNVFSESIRYLKDHFLTCSKASGFGFQEDDVHWVLTVPAIWKDNAKQFMREAAIQAGINPDLLTMAYEPEAAAIYCKDLTVQRKEGADGRSLASVEPGQQFLVLDCGGGTVDVTSYEVQENFALKEINRPTGGPWGGTYVDKEFFTFLKELFGTDVIEAFKENCPGDDLDLTRQFEAKKRGFNPKSSKKINVAMPSRLFETFRKMRNVSFKDHIQKSDYANVVKLQNDKLRFEPKVMEEFFQNSVTSIIDHIKGLLTGNGRRIKHILMVGGFSDSPILHEKVKEQFGHLNVIVPNEAVTAVLKGAVMYGHSPDLISERVCPRTYGITTSVPFDEEKHDARFKAFVDGEWVCTDIFKTIVHCGKPLIVGKSKFDILCRPAHAFDTVATVELYESNNENPVYTTDEGVKRLGIFEVPIPDISNGKNRPIQIILHFGYTELFVTALEVGTNRTTEVKFDCLLR